MSKNKPEKHNSEKKSFVWLALAFALFVIGIHQALTVGFEYSYWIFMLSISLLLLHRYKNKPEDNSPNKNAK